MSSNTLFLHIPGLDCLWWLLLAMLLPLLLGLLLGLWLWYQYKKQSAELEMERDQLHDRNNELERSNAELKYKKDELEKDNTALHASINSLEADLAVMRGRLERQQRESAGETEQDADVAGRGLGIASLEGADIDYASLFAPGELQIVEGIGPKVEEVLKNAGINTWAELAGQSQEDLKSLLAAAGPAYKMMEPKSWPQQARLASEGKWDELVKYQKFLDTGREDQGDFVTPAKIETLALRRMDDIPKVASRGPLAVGYAAIFQTSDLKIIEGIGPKLEEVLKKGGYANWAAIAKASPEELSETLEKADPKYRIHNPETWPRQAELAAEGKWDELVEYQKFLDTGEEKKGDFETPSKVEKLAAKIMGFAGANPEDLKIIEGIGPKIEELLKNNGIRNWQELAFTTTDEIQDLLAASGKNFRLADPSSWPQQALLAAEGKWKELKDYQDFLQGGKTPE